jgi:hypothetical protein
MSKILIFGKTVYDLNGYVITLLNSTEEDGGGLMSNILVEDTKENRELVTLLATSLEAIQNEKNICQK